MASRVIYGCIAVLFLVFIVVGSTAKLYADTSSATWLDLKTKPVASYGTNYSFVEITNIRRERSILPDNLDSCTTKTVPINQYGDTDTSCWKDTSIGMIGESGYMFLPKGSSIAGCINDCSTRIVPTKNPDVFFELVDEDGETAHIALRTPETAKVTQTPASQSGDYSSLAWSVPPAYQPSDAHDSAISVDDNSLYTSAAVSQNGKWMLLWNPNGSFTRINLTDFQALSVSVPEGEPNSDLFAELDISNSGRYVVIDSIPMSGSDLIIFDLNACGGKASSFMTEPVRCDSRDLTALLQKQNVYGMIVPVFSGDDLLSFYAQDEYDGSYNAYFMQAPNTTVSNSNYIGTGDSYASGEGAFSYLPGTDENENKCHLSALTYTVVSWSLILLIL